MKKPYVVVSKCTECALGIVELFDKEVDVFMSTGPNPCKHGLNIFDAKIFSGQVTKTQYRIEIEPGKRSLLCLY